MPKILAILLCAAGAIGGYFCGHEIWWEDRVAHVFVPTAADVMASAVPGLSNPRQFKFIPSIQYRYEFDGHSYESGRIWPYGLELNRPQAELWAAQYVKGKSAIVYVNPRDPADVTVIRNYETWPYWPTAASLMLIAVGCGGLIGIIAPKRKTMQAVRVNGTGWHALSPSKRFSERRREAIYLFAAIGVPIAAMAWRLCKLPPPWDDGRRAFVAIAAIIFFGLAAFLGRAVRLMRSWGDLRLLVDRAPMCRGEPFTLRAEARAISRMQLDEVRARIVCIRRNLLHLGRRTLLQSKVHGERIMHLNGKTILLAGEEIGGGADTFFARHNWPGSGREGMSMYPYNLWEVRIELIGPNKQIAATFPLEVE